MHALSVTFDGKDKIVQRWTRSQPGKTPEVMDGDPLHASPVTANLQGRPGLDRPETF